MPRVGRKSLNTTFFHIIVQGINKEYIFKKDEYIKEYRKLIIKNMSEYNVKIISYCIMNNHAHILLYTEETEEMASYMKSVNTSYARYYNRNEERVGFVFRNRYKSEPIYDNRYLLNCIGYIHNNPVKAKMVKFANEYAYSSYNDYIYKRGIVKEDILKLVFGNNNNYIGTYNEIHKSEHYFKDYDEAINYKIICDKLKNQNIKEIVSDKEILTKTIEELVIKERMKINKVSEILGISRFRVSRILGKK